MNDTTRTRRVKLTVRGIGVVTATQRRYVVVAVRAEDIVKPEGTYVKFASVEKRSDSRDTARSHASRLWNANRGSGVSYVVIDTTTGEEV